MKKVTLATMTFFALASCNSQQNETATVSTDTSKPMQQVVTDNTGTTTTVAYVPAEGDVMYKDGHIMTYRTGNWELAKADVTLDNGIVVSPSGEVRGSGKNITLTEGESVSKSGNFFDRTGNAISDGWDATKHGVSTGVEKAGEGIATGADKTGDAASKAWDATKKGVGTAADKTGDAASKAWDATKKGAKKVGEKTKEVVNGE